MPFDEIYSFFITGHVLKKASADQHSAFSFCIKYDRLSIIDAVTFSNVDRDALTACCALVLLEPARMAMEFLVLPPRLSERKTFGCKNTVGGYRRPPDPR